MRVTLSFTGESVIAAMSAAEVSIISVVSLCDWICAFGIQVPGNMSWNWLISISLYSGSTSVLAAIRSFLTAWLTVKNSKSRRPNSALRLLRLMLCWLVNVARWSSKYSSPVNVFGLTAVDSINFIASLTSICSAFGTPFKSLQRAASSIISNCGPPPPSP